MSEQILLTREGYDNLVKRHEYLVSVRREEVSRHLKEAKSYGDLSENAEYDAAKDEQAELEEEIQKLEATIRDSKVVDTDDMAGDRVNLGLFVTVKDHEYDETDVYQIVGITDADPLNGKISNESPLGRMLIGKKVGDKVDVDVEGDTITYEILDIKKSL